MGKKSAPKAPDLGPYADALEAQGEWAYLTSQDQLAWAREQDAANRQVLDRVLSVQLPAMEQQFQNAQQDRQRYEDVYQPIEDNLIQDFQSYGTPERMAQERGRAVADVAAAFDAQRRNALQRLEGYGVDPSQTRNAALDIGVRTQQAAAQAAAMTNAQRVTEDKGRALRADALNIGRGMPSQVAQSYGQAVAAGSQGVGGANSTFGTAAGAMGNPASWAQMGQAGVGGAGNMQSQGFQNSMASWQGTQGAQNDFWGGVGSLAGMAMTLADGGRPKAPPGIVDYGPSDGTGIDDQVPVDISVGEYVIPADVVKRKGIDFFDDLVNKYHTPAAEQRKALPIGG